MNKQVAIALLVSTSTVASLRQVDGTQLSDHQAIDDIKEPIVQDIEVERNVVGETPLDLTGDIKEPIVQDIEVERNVVGETPLDLTDEDKRRICQKMSDFCTANGKVGGRKAIDTVETIGRELQKLNSDSEEKFKWKSSLLSPEEKQKRNHVKKYVAACMIDRSKPIDEQLNLIGAIKNIGRDQIENIVNQDDLEDNEKYMSDYIDSIMNVFLNKISEGLQVSPAQLSSYLRQTINDSDIIKVIRGQDLDISESQVENNTNLVGAETNDLIETDSVSEIPQLLETFFGKELSQIPVRVCSSSDNEIVRTLLEKQIRSLKQDEGIDADDNTIYKMLMSYVTNGKPLKMIIRKVRRIVPLSQLIQEIPSTQFNEEGPINSGYLAALAASGGNTNVSNVGVFPSRANENDFDAQLINQYRSNKWYPGAENQIMPLDASYSSIKCERPQAKKYENVRPVDENSPAGYMIRKTKGPYRYLGRGLGGPGRGRGRGLGGPGRGLGLVKGECPYQKALREQRKQQEQGEQGELGEYRASGVPQSWGQGFAY